MTTISAECVLASMHAVTKQKVYTLLLRYPRCIHAEFMTHRVFSRNASSSRAIPVKKLIQDVFDDPFVPLVWGRNQKGMQGGEEHHERVRVLSTDFGGSDRRDADWLMSNVDAWLTARDHAVSMASRFADAGYHKQIVNRLLEPFAHITVVVSGTQWSNFFALRMHKDAEPHIRLLADRMWAAMEMSEPVRLEPGQWHLPFTDIVDANDEPVKLSGGDALQNAIKLSVARCASTSYKTVDGFDITLERAIDLHDKLVASVPLHASPCEHQARVDYVQEHVHGKPVFLNEFQRGNFAPGWQQYRKTLAGECL